MQATERLNSLLLQLRADGIIIEPKASRWYWKVLAFLLTVISFGQIKFMDTSVTTLVNRIGTPSTWDPNDVENSYEVLLHESTHVRQYKKYGFGNIWFGAVVVGFAYLLLPFPVGIAYCRARIEWEAYEQSIRAIIQTYGVDAVKEPDMKAFFVSQFTSAAYLWMWPFPGQVSKWYDAAVARIAFEEGT
jgi:hypothetical protein